MSRDKQIEEMAEITKVHCELENQCGSCHWSTCNECLAEVLYNAGYRKQEWISVEERLPEPNTNVLIYVFFHNQWQIVKGWLSYCDKKFHISNSDYPSLTDIPVTHWMPLPEPPETKGETE